MRLVYTITIALTLVHTGRSQCITNINMPPPFIKNYLGTNMPVAYPQNSQVDLVPMIETSCGSHGCYYTDANLEIGFQMNEVLSNYEAAGTNGYLQYPFYSNSAPPEQSIPATPFIMFVSVHYATDVDPAGDWGIATVSSGNYGTSITPVWALGGAVIRIFNDTITTSYLTNIRAHEVGHTYALADCYQCQERSTIMLGSNLDLTGPNASPRYCDVQQIWATAY